MDITPSHFATTLGLTSEPCGYRTTLPSRRESEELLTMCSQLRRMGIIQQRSFFEEFAALYAPQFHAAYVSLPFDYDSPLFRAYTSWAILGLTQSAAGMRFYRERPLHFSPILDVALRAIMAGVPVDTQADWTASFERSKYAFYLYGSLDSISSLYYPQDPPPTPCFPRLELHLQTLGTLLLVLRQEGNAGAVSPLERSFVADVAYLAMGDREPIEVRRQKLLASAPWSWCCCELGVESGSGARCDVLLEGREMDACGRCRSIRYCSREHQRAHWKEHKKFCFAPTW